MATDQPHSVQAHSGTPTPLLTLAVPTYNRRLKVKRLLDRLAEINEQHPWGNDLEVLVSDNASDDDTTELVNEYRQVIPALRSFRHDHNVGFDGNVFQCFEQSRGTYVWLHSDDDLPDLHSVTRILEILREHSPDVLRFSFRQPADATAGAFQFGPGVHLDNTPISCIELVLRFPKVSTYVLRKMQFESSVKTYHQSTLGDGFSFVMLGLSILQHSSPMKVAVISEPLACCDADYKTLDWPPQVILNSYRQAEHPFARLHCPKLSATMKYKGYMHAIDLAYQVKQGQYQTTIPKSYANFGATVPYRLHYLIKRPKSILRLWALKRDADKSNCEPTRW